MTKLFEDSRLDDEEKADMAFQATVAVRDALNISRNKQQPPTYEHAIRLFYELDPDIYYEVTKLLNKKNESEIVKLYREKAALESLKRGKEIDAKDLIHEDISEFRQLKSQPNVTSEKTKHIDSRITQLNSALINLEPRHLSENSILNRDSTLAKRGNLPSETLFSDYGFTDFKLSKDRYLRVRLLHPDKAEHMTGADLLYEQVDIENNRIKLLFLQYKTWEEGVIYFSSSKSLSEQISKMKRVICDCNYCEPPKSDYDRFRFPFCSAFLRPTDKLQFSNNKMLSSGLYIPVCKVNDIKENQVKLSKNELKHTSLNHYIFDDIFNLGFTGSRWLTIEEAEEFYKSNNILSKRESLVLHTKEFITGRAKTVLTDDDYTNLD
jgi:hypothetical protein